MEKWGTEFDDLDATTEGLNLSILVGTLDNFVASTVTPKEGFVPVKWRTESGLTLAGQQILSVARRGDYVNGNTIAAQLECAGEVPGVKIVYVPQDLFELAQALSLEGARAVVEELRQSRKK